MPAEKLAGEAWRSASEPPPAAALAPVDAETADARVRLIERFALLQSELGGLYYEMAIRDSVREDVLRRRAAELQRVDAELSRLERILAGGGAADVTCSNCGALASSADQFCSSCGRPQAPPPLPPPSQTNGKVSV